MANKTDSNSYTIIFSIVMVVIVGALLAGMSSLLSEKISQNKKYEKQQNILYAMGVNRNKVKELGGGDVTFIPTEEVTDQFKKYIKKQYLIKGGKMEEADDIYDTVDMSKPVQERGLPLFVGEKDSKTYYIIPLRGKGLWDAIWGYVSVDKDFVIQGVFFDHKGETAGLGANIKERFFMDDFIGENLMDKSGQYGGVNISKSNADPQNKDKADNEIDAIAGATLTGNGVSAMFDSSVLEPYVQIIKNLNK